jgi:curved DNA-binding protein CbpA
MNRHDPYVTLGVQKSASQAEVKQRFKEKVFQLHPDRNSSSDTAQLARVMEAWAMLKDADVRRTTDQQLLQRERAKLYNYHTTQASRSAGVGFAPDYDSVWRGPDPLWARRSASKWRMRFFYIKLTVILSFLTWGSLSRQQVHREHIKRRYYETRSSKESSPSA